MLHTTGRIAAFYAEGRMLAAREELLALHTTRRMLAASGILPDMKFHLGCVLCRLSGTSCPVLFP